MKKFTFVFLCLSYFCSTEAFETNQLETYNSGRFDFNLGVDYFKSTSNFSSDGAKTSLPNGHHFQTINILAGARYVMANDFGLAAAAEIGNSESNDAIATRTNSSLSRIFLIGDYRLFSTESWDLLAKISYAQALEKVDPATDSSLNSSGANELTATVGAVINWGGFVPFGEAGINYRTEGLSTLFVYTAGAEIQFDSLAFGGDIHGYMSIKDDEKTNQALARDTITNRVNGGSRKYFSVNPNLMDSEIYLKYKVDQNLVLKAFGGYTVVGSNSAEGFHVGAAVTWGFGGAMTAASKKSSPKSSKKSGTQKAITLDPSEKDFVEDTNDGVNQDYFKPVRPSKDNYIEKLDGGTQNIDNGAEPEAAAEPKKVKPKAAANPALEKDYKIKIKKKMKKKPSS